MKQSIAKIGICVLLTACGGGGGDNGTSTQAAKSTIRQFTDPSGKTSNLIFITGDYYDWIKNNAVPFRSNQIVAGDDFADLEKFGQTIGDKRIVSLAEFSHGDANSFALLNRLVQYLHQKKGFEVLAMESAMFDVDAIWQSATINNASVADLAPGRIFYMYSKNDAARQVLHYVDQQRTGNRPLILAGVDQPAGGDTSIKELVPALETFLLQRGSTLPNQSNWQNFTNVAQKAIELTSGSLKDTSNFATVANQIRTEICSDSTMAATARNTASWWCLQVGGLIAAVERQKYITQHGEDPLLDPRDEQMAQNLIWLATKKYADKKIIIWSNQVHGLKRELPECWVKNEKCDSNLYNKLIPVSMAAKAALTLGPQMHIVMNFPNGGIVADYITGLESSVSRASFDFALVLSDLGKQRYYLTNKPDEVQLLSRNWASDNPASTTSIFFPVNGANTAFYYEGATPAKVTNYPTLPLP